MGTHALALLAALDTACANVDELGQAAAEVSKSTPTMRSLRASLGWPTSPAPVCSPKSATTAHDSPTPAH